MENQKKLLLHLGAILLAAAACRLVPLAVLGPQPEPDTGAYLQVAATLAETGAFSEADPVTGQLAPYAYRMPGFHFMLAGLLKAFGPDAAWPLALANQALSVGTVLLAALFFYLLAGPGPALAAGWLAALNPNAAFNSVLLLNDSLFAFLSMLMLLAGLQALKRPSGPRFFTWGLAIGLCCLVRPILKFYWVVPLLLVFLPSFQASLARRARLAALAALGVAVLLGPWALRNRSQVGFLGLELNQGVNTLLTTSDLVRPSTPQDYAADPVQAKVRDLMAASPGALEGEYAIRRELKLPMPEISSRLTRLGVETMLREPGKAGLRALRNLANIVTSPNSVMELAGRLGGGGPRHFPGAREALRSGAWPAAALNLGVRLALAIIFLVLAPLGLLALWREAGQAGKPGLLLALSLILYTLLLTSLVTGYDRYRLPLDPLLLGLAAAAFPLVRRRPRLNR